MRDAVGAVVVSYNAKDHLLACVGSLLLAGVSEVVVADNGSQDGSELALLERYPAVKWVPTGANLGYGKAANFGARRVGSQYLLVCNPDVTVGQEAVAVMLRVLGSRAEVGVVGPRIVGVDGRLYPSARRFPDLLDAFGHGFVGQFWAGNPFSKRYRMDEWDHATGRDVDWVSGSCFMARRRAWEMVGGFDPSYFMYLEDVDLCWRLRNAGWVVSYEPVAQVVHVQGVSADRHPYRMLFAHHVSMWRFATRTTHGAKRAVLLTVVPGLALRFALTSGRRFFSGLRHRSPQQPLASSQDGAETSGPGRMTPGTPDR